MSEEIRIIEQALLNSMPSRQTILAGGWVIRLNQSCTYRANCICPLNYRREKDTLGKIRLCENLMLHNGISPVFKVTPALQEDLPGILQSLGYREVKKVFVLRGEVAETGRDPAAQTETAEAPDNEWLAAYVKFSGVTAPEPAAVLRRGIREIAIPAVFVKAVKSGKVVGCGYGTLEHAHVGIYGLHVDAAYRRQGIGSAVCGAILQFGREQNAAAAYLIVHSQNRNALSLYGHLGFSRLYDYAFYEKAGRISSVVDC